MIKDLVSVIVPVYNVEKYLRDCLDSILAQTYSNIEVILINDGSKDGSGSICDEYAAKDSRIKVLHKENGGVSKARNAGLDMMQGEFFSFVDGDDTVEPDYLELMLGELRIKDVDLIRLSWKRGTKECSYRVKFDKMGSFLVTPTNIDDLAWFANIWGLFKTENLNSIRFKEDLKYAEDNLFVFEYFWKSKQKRMGLINKPYYNYRIVNHSASNLDPFKFLNASQNFVKYVQELDPQNQNVKKLCKSYIYKDYLRLLYYFVDHDKKSENGISIQELRSKIENLRKDGAKTNTKCSAIVSFIYRHHLHFIMKFYRNMVK